MPTTTKKQKKVLPDGHPRRLSDGRNAWRKMNPEQRKTFVAFLISEGLNEYLPQETYAQLVRREEAERMESAIQDAMEYAARDK